MSIFLKKMFKKFAVQGDNIITGGHFPLPPMFPGCLMGMARFFAEPFFWNFSFYALFIKPGSCAVYNNAFVFDLNVS